MKFLVLDPEIQTDKLKIQGRTKESQVHISQSKESAHYLGKKIPLLSHNYLMHIEMHAVA